MALARRNTDECDPATPLLSLNIIPTLALSGMKIRDTASHIKFYFDQIRAISNQNTNKTQIYCQKKQSPPDFFQKEIKSCCENSQFAEVKANFVKPQSSWQVFYLFL